MINMRALCGGVAVLLAAAALARCSSINLEKPRPYPCSPDGGNTECPDNWRCGLEGFCHARDVGAGYLCETDSDCEMAWRCGADGRCVDADEGFGPNLGAGTPVVSRVSPNLVRSHPSLVELSGQFEFSARCGSGSVRAQSYSFVSDGGLTKVTLFPNGREATYDAGAPVCGTSAPREHLDVQRAEVGQAVALADQGHRSYVLSDAGTFCVGGSSRPGAPFQLSCRPAEFGFPAEELRVGERDWVAAFSPSEVAFRNVSDGGAVSRAPIRGSDGGPLEIHDVLTLEREPGEPPLFYAATSRGLFVSTPIGEPEGMDGGASRPWAPVSLFGLGCDLDDWFLERPTRLRVTRGTQSDDVLLVQTHLDFGGGQFHEAVKIFSEVQPSQVVSSSACPSPPAARSATTDPRVFGKVGRDCGPCATGSRVKDFQVHPSSSQSGQHVLEMRCENLDGGAPDVSRYSDVHQGCRSVGADDPGDFPNSALYRGQTKVSRANPRAQAYSSPLGQLWIDEAEGLEKSALFLDRVPATVLGDSAASLVAHAPAVRFDESREEPAKDVALGRRTYTATPLGLTKLDGDFATFPMASGVEGQRSWAVVRDAEGERVFVLGILPGFELRAWLVGRLTTTELWRDPFLASSARTPDGGTLLVLSSYDAMLAADVTRSRAWDGGDLEDADVNDAPLLEVKMVPLTRTAITSLSLLEEPSPNDGGTLFAEGFFLAGGRAFRMRALNPVVWRHDELFLPEGEALEVWREGRKGRVGFRDGRVFSLPSRTTLSQPLPAGAGEVKDYASLCGQVFALARDGLFRLVSDGTSPVAHWDEVPIPEGLLPAGTLQFAEGKLHAGAQELFLFLPSGWVLQVGGLSCAP